MIFFRKIVPSWVYFGQGEDFKLAAELSEKVQYPLNEAIKNGLNEAILLILINETLLSSQNFLPFEQSRFNSIWRWFELLTRSQQKYPILRACWRVNKHGDPIFLLHFYNVHIMNVHYAKFKKKFDSRTISRELP